MLHLMTVATGSAAERGLPSAAARQVLDVVTAELDRLSEGGGLTTGDHDDLAALRRRAGELQPSRMVGG